MAIQRNQELVDRLRSILNLSTEITDDELWRGTKDSFLCAKINLATKIQAVINGFILSAQA